VKCLIKVMVATTMLIYSRWELPIAIMKTAFVVFWRARKSHSYAYAWPALGFSSLAALMPKRPIKFLPACWGEWIEKCSFDDRRHMSRYVFVFVPTSDPLVLFSSFEGLKEVYQVKKSVMIEDTYIASTS